MKKLISVLLCLTLAASVLFALTGCGGNNDPVDPEPTEFTVSFDTWGGSAVASQTVKAGGLVTKPADPTKANLVFKGWFKSQDTDADAWNFETDTVTDNVTIYAQWEPLPAPSEFTVTFDTHGGTAIDAVTVAAGAAVAAPETDPTLEGYTFKGWYADAEGETPWDFNTVIEEDTTIHAVWEQIVDDGGNEGGEGGEGGGNPDAPEIDEDVDDNGESDTRLPSHKL
jgi:uncharacterized repeat protein (TIGR02543 family)